MNNINQVLEKMEDTELFSLALLAWGVPAQEDTLIEEAAELIKAIMKMRRHLKRSPPQVATYHAFEDRILSELADLQLLLNQIKDYYTGGNDAIFDEHYNASKAKLRDLLAASEPVNLILTVGPEPKDALVADRLEKKGTV